MPTAWISSGNSGLESGPPAGAVIGPRASTGSANCEPTRAGVLSPRRSRRRHDLSGLSRLLVELSYVVKRFAGFRHEARPATWSGNRA